MAEGLGPIARRLAAKQTLQEGAPFTPTTDTPLTVKTPKVLQGEELRGLRRLQDARGLTPGELARRNELEKIEQAGRLEETLQERNERAAAQIAHQTLTERSR